MSANSLDAKTIWWLVNTILRTSVQSLGYVLMGHFTDKDMRHPHAHVLLSPAISDCEGQSKASALSFLALQSKLGVVPQSVTFMVDSVASMNASHVDASPDDDDEDTAQHNSAIARSEDNQAFPPNDNVGTSVSVWRLPTSNTAEDTQNSALVTTTTEGSPPPSISSPPGATLPVFAFNRERYPAYDIHARRIGLQQTLMGTEPFKRGSYYRLRTHFYPGPDASANDSQHVISFDSQVPSTDTSIPRDELLAGEERTGVSDSLHSSPSGPQPTIDSEERSASPPSAPPQQTIYYPGQYVITEPRATTPEIRQILRMEPDEEVSLRALADPPPGERPVYSFPTLIMLAIHDSSKKQLTLQEIYLALQSRFEWYRDHPDDKSWQNSIRHNLSLNKCFRRISRRATDPGKGSYWALDLSQGPGRKRPHHRNKKPTKAQLRRLAEQAARKAEGNDGTAQQTEESTDIPTNAQGHVDHDDDSGNDSDDVRLMLYEDPPVETDTQNTLSFEPDPVSEISQTAPSSPVSGDSHHRSNKSTMSFTSLPDPLSRSQEEAARTGILRTPAPLLPSTGSHWYTAEIEPRSPPIAGPSRIRRPPSPPYLPPLPLRKIQATQSNLPTYLRLDSTAEDVEMVPSSPSPSPSPTVQPASHTPPDGPISLPRGGTYSLALFKEIAERVRSRPRLKNTEVRLATPAIPVRFSGSSAPTASRSSAPNQAHPTYSQGDAMHARQFGTSVIPTQKPSSSGSNFASLPPNRIVVTNVTRMEPRTTSHVSANRVETIEQRRAMGLDTGADETVHRTARQPRIVPGQTLHTTGGVSTQPQAVTISSQRGHTAMSNPAGSTSNTRRRAKDPKPFNVHPLNWKAIYPDIPYPGSTPPTQASASTASSADVQVAAPASSVSQPSGPTGGRRVYTDSRGTVYPTRGENEDYSSDSDG